MKRHVEDSARPKEARHLGQRPLRFDYVLHHRPAVNNVERTTSDSAVADISLQHVNAMRFACPHPFPQFLSLSPIYAKDLSADGLCCPPCTVVPKHLEIRERRKTDRNGIAVYRRYIVVNREVVRVGQKRPWADVE